MSRPRGTLVLDAGGTNTKLFLFDSDGNPVAERRTATAVSDFDDYLATDAEPALAFFRETLPDFDAILPVDAIVTSAHGSGLALIDGDGMLALPVMHYKAEPPADIRADYLAMAPPFEEICAQTNPMALTLGLQLLWQERRFPELFAKVRTIIPWGQYFSFRMTGVAVGELTALGAQSHLIRPHDNSYTALMAERGWDRLMAPIMPAFATLGKLKPEFIAAPLRGRLMVKTGVHDSNANYARYLAAGISSFTLMSTGTWIILFNGDCPIEALVDDRDTCTNTNIFGQPVVCARFMGGEEYDVLTGGEGADPSPEIAASLVSVGVMALPSFTDSGGPVPGTGGGGRIVGRQPEDPAERATLASLYCAMMTSLSLDIIRSKNRIIVDGPFASNPVFCSALATLRADQQISLSDLRDGTAAGAALLGLFEEPEQLPHRPLELHDHEAAGIPGLQAYHENWLKHVRQA